MFGNFNYPRRRAAVVVQVAVALPLLIGFSALTVDVGTIYNAKSDMQRATDAAALAAIAEFAYAGEAVDAVEIAKSAAAAFAEANPVLTRILTVDPDEDIVFGRAYYDPVANTYDFVPDDVPTNAIRVTIRHAEDSPNGPLPLYFAGIFGKSMTDVAATSVALFTSSCYTQGDCYDEAPAGKTIMCKYGDSDDSDDSQGEFGDPDSDDSDDSDLVNNDSGDSESGDSEADSDGGHTVIVDTVAIPLFLSRGSTLGACDFCPVGDSDDSDDSQGEFGPPDSSDSDDSDSGDSDGSINGDSDDSDDSQGEFGPPDSDDSDDSDSGDSDGSVNGDSDDSDDSQGEFGPPDSDDSDDSDGSEGADSDTINVGNAEPVDACVAAFRFFLIQ